MLTHTLLIALAALPATAFVPCRTAFVNLGPVTTACTANWPMASRPMASRPMASRPMASSAMNLRMCSDSIRVYDGPTCDSLSNVMVSIELEESGIAVEVADSLIADGGRGLFVRLMDDVESVTLDACTAFCGYAAGSMHQEADSACGKSVAFLLRGPGESVFFEGQLWTVKKLFEEGENIEGIAGHTVMRDAASGEVLAIQVDATYNGPRYFIPETPPPLPLSIMSIGQFANDLAIGADGAEDSEYASRSKQKNLLALVQRLERDPDSANQAMLRPSRPISTLSRTVTFRNSAPMEIGCEYGARYWTEGELRS